MFITKKKHQAEIKKLELVIKKGEEKINQVSQAWNMDKRKFQNEIQELKKIAHDSLNKLRGQTESDLYFNCAKIQKDLLDGKKKIEVSDQEKYIILSQNRLAETVQKEQYINNLGTYSFLGSALRCGIF